jgi:glycosyltransferase involved in cell wall biosynthesis
VVVIGALPPPANGVTLSLRHLLESPLAERFELTHVDVSDPREISKVERLDLRNVWLGLKAIALSAGALARKPALCYLPLARNRLGVLRDGLLLVLARLLGVPAVAHFHGAGFDAFYRSEPAAMRLLIRLALSRRTHVVVLGNTRRDDFRGLVPPERVHVVANGIPDVAKPPADRDGRCVVYLGNLSARKGVFDFLEASAHVLSELGDARIVVAGPWFRPADQQVAQQRIAELGLAGRVLFPGPVDEAGKVALLAGADLLALPSYHEGMPLVILEALRSGVPVVATQVGSVPETVADGVEGRLVEPGDVDGLAACVLELLRDDALRARLAKAARARYEREFTLDRFASQLAAVFETAIAARQVRAPQSVSGEAHA